MPAQIIDGKKLAERVRAEVKERAQKFAEKRGRQPGLDVVLVGNNPASEVYVRNKEKAAQQCGIAGRVHKLSAETPEGELLVLIDQLNNDPSVDGILVQLPLPKQLDSDRIISALDPRKDVDGLHPINLGLLCAGRQGLRACTPSGCMRMLEEIACDPKGKRAVVVGRSILVGKPIALMLLEKHATVTLAHSRTQELAQVVKEADIVVAAVGQPEMIRGEWIKPGAVVIDVGINRRDDGTLVGDVAFAEAKERASYITPVPGGVGPMTIAMLLQNTMAAAENR